MHIGGGYISVAVAWVANVPSRLGYMPSIPVNPHADACRVHYGLLRRRRREHMRSITTSHNPIANPMIHCCGGDQEGPVTH